MGASEDSAATGGMALGGSARDDGFPLRVSTLEIFFDLVFAFTLTQLTFVLASRVSWLAVGQVMLIFGLLWWMYGAYAWLTNRAPRGAAHRRAQTPRRWPGRASAALARVCRDRASRERFRRCGCGRIEV